MQLQQFILVMLGALLTWTFYFVQRRIERRKTTEVIERHQKLLALKQGLDGANVSLDDLRRFENRLVGKAETAVKIADGYVTQAETVLRHGAAELLANDEASTEAMDAFRQADARLTRVIEHLSGQLDDEARATFEATQRAFQAFRERYARFIAQSYSGGAIRPLIHAVTLESVTAAWSAELETQLGVYVD